MFRATTTLLCLLALSACASDPAPGADASGADASAAAPEPIALADALPETLLGRERQSLDTDADAALGAEVSEATARYGEITVALTDFQTAEMAQMMGYAGLAAETERYLGHPVQRTEAASSAAAEVLIDGRVLVEVTAGSAAAADSALAALDLAPLQR